MKNKIIVFIFIFILVACFNIGVYATENIVNEEGNVYLELADVNMTNSEIVEAKVIEASDILINNTAGFNIKYQELELEVLEGDYKGEFITSTYNVTYDIDGKIEGYPLEKGNKVYAEIVIEAGEITESIVQNVKRSTAIYWMIGVFFLLILLVGKTKGLKAIIAFIITILGIFFVMLQSIINGYDAILMSILVSSGIIVFTFLIIAGFNKKSATAMIGTVGGVVCAGLMAAIFGYFAKLSGGQEEAIYLSLNTKDIVFNFRDLLFAGIVISSLGACMDVGMSIASSLNELKEKKPDLTAMELIKSGMTIGGDIIGTMTNTLILAYIGGAINLVLLYMVNDTNINDILNVEMIATDAISAIAASMGVIFTVPITAFVFAFFNKEGKANHKTSGGIKEGKRSLKI